MEIEQYNYLKGRGAQINTSNKYLAHTTVYEPDDHLIAEDYLSHPHTQYLIENPKTIINEVPSPDLGIMHSVNPYQGCEHGCIYCYARNAHQYWGYSAGIDFETKIMVKKNAPELFEKAISANSWVPQPISLSGNTDCYQPAERKYELTRKILQICLKYRHPVGIITKNALILRDIDILSELAKLQLVCVYISVTTLDEALRRTMEPRTVTATQRLNILKKLTEAGIACGIMNAPIMPGLNSHEIPDIIAQAASHGALAAGYTIVRLNGAIGDIFTDWLTKNYPDRAQKVLHQIMECHGGTLNDSRFGTRISGEGKIAQQIALMHKISKNKYMPGRAIPKLRCDLFTKNGQQKLF
ncbi:MAG: PA0069 family radical SAM protein [Cytophagales bacterium]|nr:PA0069 family radical SAM protein [Cytophagales bacterium]